MNRVFLKIHVISAVILFWFISVLAVHGNEEKQPSFVEIVTSTSDSHLLFFAKINNAFTEEMIEGLNSGVPVQFSFAVEMREKKKTKAEDNLLSLKFQHILTYDTLKANYQIVFEELPRKNASFSSIKPAQQAMSEINGMQLIELNKLKPNTVYELRIRAQLYKRILPKGLQGIEPILALWNIETDWQRLDFTVHQLP